MHSSALLMRCVLQNSMWFGSNLIIYPPTTIGELSSALYVMKGESHNLSMYQLNLPNHLIAKIFLNLMKSHFGIIAWLIMIKRPGTLLRKKSKLCPAAASVDWQNTNTIEVAIINHFSTMFQVSFISITSSISLHMSQTKEHGFCLCCQNDVTMKMLYKVFLSQTPMLHI